MLKIVLLGSGNVATHLFQAFRNVSVAKVVQVYGRNSSALESFGKETDITMSPKKIKDADIYIIAVTDHSITEISSVLLEKKGLVAHTSGSVTLNSIRAENKGVFYPLQTFSEGKKMDFKSIPILIEAETEGHYQLLHVLGNHISNEVHRVSSEQRKKLHLAAVFVNNFPNHLFHIAHQICQRENIAFELLLPLISETVDKIRFLSPKASQTGPGRRNDVDTMQDHLEQLENPLQKKIYHVLSESIKKTYEKEL